MRIRNYSQIPGNISKIYQNTRKTTTKSLPVYHGNEQSNDEQKQIRHNKISNEKLKHDSTKVNLATSYRRVDLFQKKISF